MPYSEEDARKLCNDINRYLKQDIKTIEDLQKRSREKDQINLKDQCGNSTLGNEIFKYAKEKKLLNVTKFLQDNGYELIPEATNINEDQLATLYSKIEKIVNTDPDITIEEFNKELKREKINIKITGQGGWTLFYYAIRSVQSNVECNTQCSAIFLKIIELLVNLDSGINFKDTASKNGLDRAVINGRIDAVKILLNSNKFTKEEISSGLLNAIIHINYQVVELFLQHAVDSRMQVDIDYQMLSCAIESCCNKVEILRIVQLLLKHKAGCKEQGDTDCIDNTVVEVFFYAVEKENIAVIHLFCEQYGLGILKATDEHGRTALLYAIDNNLCKAAARLLQDCTKEDLEIKDNINEGRTALKIAEEKGYQEIVKMLQNFKSQETDKNIFNEDPQLNSPNVRAALEENESDIVSNIYGDNSVVIESPEHQETSVEKDADLQTNFTSNSSNTFLPLKTNNQSTHSNTGVHKRSLESHKTLGVNSDFSSKQFDSPKMKLSQKEINQNFYCSLGESCVGVVAAGLLVTASSMVPSIIGAIVFCVLASIVALGTVLHIKNSTIPSYREMKGHTVESINLNSREV